MRPSLLLMPLALLAGLAVACASSEDQGGPGTDTAGVDAGGDAPLTDVGFATDPGALPDAPAEVAPEAGDEDAPADTATPDPGAPDLPVEATPDTSSPGTQTCKQFYQECANLCPTAANGLPEPACFEACRPGLSAEGSQTLDAFLSCLANAGCDNQPDDTAKLLCYAGTCDDEYFACFHGDDTCGQVLTCMGGCPQDATNGACVVTCTQDGTVEAQKKLVGILTCIADTCCPDDAAACNTEAGKACSQGAVKMGGACFGQVTGCLVGG